MTDRLRVAIIGGGLGGLCLAQGLRGRGISATVYERDPSELSRRQGYRIHIGPVGAAALRQCLPPDLYELFLATAGRTGRQVTVLSSRLRELKSFPSDLEGDQVSVPVNRLTLREVLLAELGDAVRFGYEFSHYESIGDTVRAHFVVGDSFDADPVDADILVGADGISSAVRRQLLPQATLVDTGTRVIYGKTLLDERTRSMLPAAAYDGFVAVTALLRPAGMALGLLEFRDRPPLAAARLHPALTMRDCDDYVMWALSAPSSAMPADLTAMDGTELCAIVGRMTRHWHPRLRGLIDAAETDETFALAVRVSTPIGPWLSGRVTVLGDAIHAMSPAGGSGANTALCDAALLCRELAADHDDPVAAIGRYEAEMRDYGFAAVRASQEAEARYRRAYEWEASVPIRSGVAATHDRSQDCRSCWHSALVTEAPPSML